MFGFGGGFGFFPFNLKKIKYIFSVLIVELGTQEIKYVTVHLKQTFDTI